MPTPPKPVIVLEQEKRSHRTKKEIEDRRKAESSLLSGKKLTERPEVKSNPTAHQEFKRVSKLFQEIGKNDALYTAVINRYCQLYAECRETEERLQKMRLEMDAWLEEKRNGGMLQGRYLRFLSEIQKNLNTLENICAKKRGMMLDIEKECIMTIASALRSIPKKPEKEEEQDPMAALLARRRA